MSTKIVIVGAGPGGLTAGMLLSSRGYNVTIYEKNQLPGGRNGPLSLGEYTFDTGPTFLIMKSLLDEIFQIAGKRPDDYLKFTKIDPLYQLVFPDGKKFSPPAEEGPLGEVMDRIWPGSSEGLKKYVKAETRKMERVAPLLSRPFLGFRDLLRKDFFRSIPVLNLHRNLFRELFRYFRREDLVYSFAFQAKYIGMSPWKAPSLFSILSWLEHSEGLYHVEGGLNRISFAMADIIREHGGIVETGKTVSAVDEKNGRASGVILADGTSVRADHVILNADFAYGASNLIPRKLLKRWHPEKLKRKLFSCSTFLIYLGLDCLYTDLPHHNIVFSRDYRRYVEEITETLIMPEDPSFYVHNPSLIDPSLAPPGNSSLYLLVPVPNNRSHIDWKKEAVPFRNRILALAEEKLGLQGLESHIREEKILSPEDWEKEYNVYDGAVFNLGHNFSQMLMFRPHNHFEEMNNLYLVGGGTHPGSGLPTIYQSGIIASSLIQREGSF